MPQTSIKLLLFTLFRELNLAKEMRKEILERHQGNLTNEVNDQLDKINKKIEAIEKQINNLLE